MLYYISNHSIFIFFFFTFPLVSLITHRYLTKEAISYILYPCIVFLLPVLSGYSYIIENMYGFLFYISLTCIYTLCVKKFNYKIASSFILATILFFICGFLSFMGAFTGSIIVEKEWTLKKYKIQYVRDQGFSGGPLVTYQLSKYAIIPLFIKHIDTEIDNDTTQNCWIKFTDAGFNFNKCEPDSSFLKK